MFSEGCLGMDYSLVTFSKLESAVHSLTSLDRNLVCATKANDYAAVKSLIEAGANVNCSPAGWTPLYLSCYYGYTKLVQYFLQLSLKELRCWPPSQVCIQCQHLCYQSTYDDQGNTHLIAAAKEGHLEVCKLLLEADICLEQTNKLKEQTALLVAAEQKQTEICLLLLEYGACVQVSDNIGMTPLYAAIKCHDSTVIQKLIRNGCNVNIGSQDHPPIFLAARLGQFDTVQMLIKSGCQKDVCNKYGVTPVYESTLKGYHDILEFLLEKGCDPDKADMYKKTPLHIASLQNDRRAAELLVTAGASLRLRDDHNYTAIQLALKSGNADVLEYFLTFGVDLSHKDALGSERFAMFTVCELFKQYHVKSILVLIRDNCHWPFSKNFGIELEWGDTDLPDWGIVNMFSREGLLLKTLMFSGNLVSLKALNQTDSSLCVSRFSTNNLHIPASVIIVPMLITPLVDPELSNWLNNFHRLPLTLLASARIAIRRCFGSQILKKTRQLSIPKMLKDYITLKDL